MLLLLISIVIFLTYKENPLLTTVQIPPNLIDKFYSEKEKQTIMLKLIRKSIYSIAVIDIYFDNID